MLEVLKLSSFKNLCFQADNAEVTYAFQSRITSDLATTRISETKRIVQQVKFSATSV